MPLGIPGIPGILGIRLLLCRAWGEPPSQNIFWENVPRLFCYVPMFEISLACFFLFFFYDPFMGSPGNLTTIARTVVKFYVGWYQEWLEILILDPIRCENFFYGFCPSRSMVFFWFFAHDFFWFLVENQTSTRYGHIFQTYMRKVLIEKTAVIILLSSIARF